MEQLTNAGVSLRGIGPYCKRGIVLAFTISRRIMLAVSILKSKNSRLNFHFFARLLLSSPFSLGLKV